MEKASSLTILKELLLGMSVHLAVAVLICGFFGLLVGYLIR